MTNKEKLKVVLEQRKALAQEYSEICDSLRRVAKDSPERDALKSRSRTVQELLGTLNAERSSLNRAEQDFEAKHATAKRELDECRREKNLLKARVYALEEQCRRLESRVAAGMERRREALICLNMLVSTETNGDDLSDAEYYARLDATVRKARTVLSLEKEAIRESMQVAP